MNLRLKRWGILILLCLYSHFLPAVGMGDFVGQQIANQIARSTSASITKSLTDALFIPRLQIRHASGKVKNLNSSGDGRLLSALHNDNTVRVWDFERGVQRPVIENRGRGQFTVVQPLSGVNLILVGSQDGNIYIFDVLTGRIVQSLDSDNGAVVSLAVTPDEKFLLAGYRGGKITVWNLQRFLSIADIMTPYGDTLKFIAVLPDGKAFITAGADGVIDKWDLMHGTKIFSLPSQDEVIDGLWINSQVPELLATTEDGTILRTDTQNGRLISKRRAGNSEALAVGVDNRLNEAAFAVEGGGIRIMDLGSFTTDKSINTENDIYRLKFLNKDSYLLGADADGVLHIWDVRSAEEILKLISTADGWTVVDNHGRFDSSEGGMRDVSWFAAEKNIPLDNFSENYYEPGLLATYLAGEPFINAQPKIVQQGITLPPEVKITLSGAAKVAGQPYFVSVEARDAGGGIADLRLYHNGKILTQTSLTQIREAQQAGNTVKIADFKILPASGRNTLHAIVTNKMGIEGQSEQISADFDGKQSTTTLHIVTVGINQYQDSRLNLDYSVADAQSIAKLLSDKKLASFSAVAEHRLYDAHAGKHAILAAFKKLNDAPQNDVLAVYFAGHGITIDGRWYFLPYDTTLQEDHVAYASYGISADELQVLLEDVKMQRIFIMVDACYSGASLAAFRKMLDAQRHFSRALSKTVGLVILAATRQDQQAAELKELGHGLFTYAVTEGMAGEADFRPRNRQISAHELADFSTLKIPSFSKQYLHASQEPTAFTMGSDFMLLESK
ncbi:MAG: caspase family protein [Gammaproteobacteria bacterium]